MKTNKSFTIVCLIAALAFASCDKTLDIKSHELHPNITVRVHVEGNQATKTSGSATQAATAAESKISSLRVFFVKADMSTVRELGADDFVFNNVTNVLQIQSPETYMGNWLLYLVANWPSGLTINTSSYSAFVGSYTAASKSVIEPVWGNNTFLMVNRQNGVTQSGIDKAGVALDLNKSYTELNPLTVEVHLERLAAKVNVSKSSTIYYYPLFSKLTGQDAIHVIISMDITGFALLNCVNSFNLIQRWQKAGTGWTADGCSEQILNTPSSSGTYTGFYDNVPSSLVFTTIGTPLYCLENCAPLYSATEGGSHPDASAATKMKGRVTGVIFKTRVATVSTFLATANLDIENLILDPDPGLWTKAGSTPEYRTIYLYKGLLYADSESLLSFNPELGSDNTTSVLRSKGVSVYEDGYMYYTYWIEDQNYTDDGENYLAVMRNTYYNLIVNQISSFGDDIPGGNYLAADPIDKDNSKISVRLDISDWDEKTALDYTIK